uniref:Si:dkeyp-77c8.3 n=1 Tax=Oryzias latipes TaxID=8090 RepID=A0A3P9M5V6_ORYLA
MNVLWSSAAQDAAAVIQNKEVQLQLVMDYCRQIQAAKTTVERLTAELDAAKSPQASSRKEVEHLCFLQRSMEENRAVLGELLMTSTKLCLHLNTSDREAVLTEQKSLQEKWTSLERTMEHAL